MHEMVFCYQNCSDLLWDREKLLKFEAEGREFANSFEITYNLFKKWKGQSNYKLQELEFKLENIIGI